MHGSHLISRRFMCLKAMTKFCFSQINSKCLLSIVKTPSSLSISVHSFSLSTPVFMCFSRIYTSSSSISSILSVISVISFYHLKPPELNLIKYSLSPAPSNVCSINWDLDKYTSYTLPLLPAKLCAILGSVVTDLRALFKPNGLVHNHFHFPISLANVIIFFYCFPLLICRMIWSIQIYTGIVEFFINIKNIFYHQRGIPIRCPQ